MNGEIFEVTPARLEQMIDLTPEEVRAVRLSSPLCVGMFGDEVVCAMGLVPQSLVSEKAYLWLKTVSDRHRLLIARHSKDFIEKVLEVYPCLVGHCLTPEAQRWLQWLGARFDGNFFELRARWD